MFHLKKRHMRLSIVVKPDTPFTDVSTSDCYYDAVLWAVTTGVTASTSTTTFSPSADVTRAQAVTFLYQELG